MVFKLRILVPDRDFQGAAPEAVYRQPDRLPFAVSSSMSMTDLPVLQAIKGKLRFHETRQKVLAENVANAETPGYTARDLKAPDFFRMAVDGDREVGVSTVLTNPMHIAGPRISTGTPFRSEKVGGYEVTPDGNAVSLEDQMMKVTSNQMDFQTVTSLYQRSLGLLKTAVGKR